MSGGKNRSPQPLRRIIGLACAILIAKESLGKLIGKFTLGIVLPDKLFKLHKVFLMQSLQITIVYTLAILSEMGSRSVLL